jgi:hypothetical protein
LDVPILLHTNARQDAQDDHDDHQFHKGEAFLLLEQFSDFPQHSHSSTS